MEQNRTDNEEEFLDVSVETALSQFVKAEVDVQISTAKAYPRSLATFKKKALSMATFSEEIAASCAYALPRKEKNQKTGVWEDKIIEGPSVRLAEIVIGAYGNIRAGARVIDNDGRVITAQGVCHDLESNTVITMETRRRITTKTGATFSDDMQVVTGNAACAIAFRNAVFKIIPAAMIADIYEEVKLVAIGTAETLIKRRNKAIAFFTEKGIKDEQICEALHIQTIEDIDLEKLGLLSGFKSTVKNGEGTLEDIFAKKEDKPADDKAKQKSDAATDATKKLIKRRR